MNAPNLSPQQLEDLRLLAASPDGVRLADKVEHPAASRYVGLAFLGLVKVTSAGDVQTCLITQAGEAALQRHLDR